MDFSKKTVWITGASSGIGEALTYEFNKLGAKIIISARREDELRRVAARCKGNKIPYILPLDLEKTKELSAKVNEVTKAFSNIDVLINNGGVSQEGLIENNTLSVERKVMDINFFGNIELSRRVCVNMKEKESGNIVVISSILGKFGLPGLAIYSASKHALHGYYEGLRQEVKPYGINVLIIDPGFINTSIAKNSLKSDGSISRKDSPSQLKGMSATNCAKKIIKAISKNKQHVYVARLEYFAVYFKQLAPKLFYWVHNKIAPKKL